MKKKHVTILLAVILIIGIIILVLFCKFDSNKRIVGIYHNDNWNNREATITINEDGTCEYPSSGDKCEWAIVESDAVMTLFYENTKDVYIDVYLEDYITKEDSGLIDGYSTAFTHEMLGYVSGVDKLVKNDKLVFRIYIFEDEYIDKVEQKVKEYEGIKNTESYKSETIIETNEHKAAIVDGGLILHDHFFKKMN